MTEIEQKYCKNISKQTQFAQTLTHLCPEKLYYISVDDELIELTFDALVPQFPSNILDYVIDLNKPLIVMYKRFDENIYMGLVKLGYDDEWFFDVYNEDKKIFKIANEAFDDKIREYSLETDRIYVEQIAIERRIHGIKMNMRDLIIKRDNYAKI